MRGDPHAKSHPRSVNDNSLVPLVSFLPLDSGALVFCP